MRKEEGVCENSAMLEGEGFKKYHSALTFE